MLSIFNFLKNVKKILLQRFQKKKSYFFEIRYCDIMKLNITEIIDRGQLYKIE